MWTLCNVSLLLVLRSFADAVVLLMLLVLLFLVLQCQLHKQKVQCVDSADLSVVHKKDHRLGSVVKALDQVYC